MSRTRISTDGIADGAVTSAKLASQIGIGTNDPQTTLQIVTGGASSTLEGAAQTEIFQIIDGSDDDFVNLGRFHCNGSLSRGSLSLSNSGTAAAWQDNVLQFFVHGMDYGYGYYGGNASDAGCAMIVTQGGDIVKLQIGNYGAAPIEFFTDNTKRFRIRTDGNYDLYASIDLDVTPGPAFVWYNTYDSGAGEIGELAAIQMLTGSTAAMGELAFYTGNGNAIAERVRIDENGKVGIGVAAPSVPLHVVSTGDGVAEVARFRRQDSGNTDGAHFSIHADNTNNLVQLRSTGTSAGSFAFYSGNNERVTIAASGEMAINSNTVLHAGNYLNYVTKTLLVFTATQGQPPASNYATLDTRNSIAVLDFDAATDESIVFIGYVPLAAVLTSGLKVCINWTATTATSGDCVWGVQFERMNTDIDADSFATAAAGTTTTNGTSGVPNVTSITITTIDSVAAGEFFRLKVYRNASVAGDTMTGDAELISVAVEMP